MRNQEYLTTYKNYLEQLKLIETKDLIRREELGIDLCFADAEDDIEQCLNLFKLLLDVDITSVPNDNLYSLNIILGNFISYINEIRNYSSKQGESRRNQLVGNLKNNYGNWYNNIAPIVAFTTKAGTDYEALQRKALEASNTLNEILAIADKERQLAKNEIDKVLESVKKAASEVGVTQHATNFKDAADKYEKMKDQWLKYNIGIIVIIIIYSFVAFIWSPINLKEPYQYTFLQSVLPRMTILFALFYGLHFANYTYRAYAHNAIVNRNKQNELATFETFVKAAEDKETKNSVLLQTTKAIFSNLPSGYLKGENGTDSPTQIIEVVKNLTKD